MAPSSPVSRSQLPIDGWIPMENGSLPFQDGECRTLAEFQQKYPTSDKDVIDFTASMSLHCTLSISPAVRTGQDRRLRGTPAGSDFGSGKQFYTTWWPHQADRLNTPEFKADIDRTVNWLREQPDFPAAGLCQHEPLL